ncbi:transposase [Fibrella sp. HMF5335]|uniref:Transposase n=1 Tax=Fibrella rubiginis TaxID=2817060 RepID=A0A939GGJ7_9BACT|nr:transposase [Fibrella rubiginis]MBO0936824.1 transposase [Fibrella rubiginis]
MSTYLRISAHLLTCCVLAFVMLSCGGGDKPEKTDTDEASISTTGTLAAVQEMAKQVEENQKNGPVETVDFRKLKDMLPTEVASLPRKSASGEKNGAAGMTFSTATARYENADDSQNIELSVVDAGGTAMLMGMAAWSMIEVDKEDDNGYERTTKMGDHKAYEKYNKSDKSGETAVLVKNRFIVTAKGHGVEPEALKSALEALDLDKLADLK